MKDSVIKFNILARSGPSAGSSGLTPEGEDYVTHWSYQTDAFVFFGHEVTT
jgi:hypothetical protein